MSCRCIRSEWDADRTMITNTFELDRSCPIHGDEAVESRAEKANRWAGFTDDELGDLLAGLHCILNVRVDISATDLAIEVEAELERRKP